MLTFPGKNSQTNEVKEPSGTKKLGDSLYGEAVLATSRCESFAHRLEMYRMTADVGHAEGRVRWANTVLTDRSAWLIRTFFGSNITKTVLFTSVFSVAIVDS